jgi:hypothetical protein
MAPMPEHRSSYESDRPPCTKIAARRAVRMTIGQELKAHYEVPQDLPREILTLLMQVSAPHEEV